MIYRELIVTKMSIRNDLEKRRERAFYIERKRKSQSLISSHSEIGNDADDDDDDDDFANSVIFMNHSL